MKASSISAFIEITKKQKKFNVPRFIKLHAPKQREYLKSKANTVLAYGAKRSGKTLASHSKIIISDITAPKGQHTFIAGTSLDKIVSLYWSKLETLNKNIGLGWSFKYGKSKIITKNREIVFISLRDKTSAEKAVGFDCFLALIEEPHTCRENILKLYIQEVIRPNFMRSGGKGQMCLTGNPPVTEMKWLRDNFYMNEDIHRIHFSPYDNPSMTKKEIRAFLLQQAKILGYNTIEEAEEKSDTYKRNYLGIWCPSTGKIIFNKDKVHCFTGLPMPLRDYSCSMGVDLGGGGSSRDALVCVVWNKYEKKAYAHHEEELETEDEDLEKLAERIKYLYEMYKPVAINVDTGGLGRRITEILRSRYGISTFPAIKQDKMAHIREMKTEITRGRLLFKPDSKLVQEFPQIIYSEKGDKIDDVAGIHSDLLDACLYAMRYVWNSWPKEKPVEKSYEDKRLEEIYNSQRKRTRLGF